MNNEFFSCPSSEQENFDVRHGSEKDVEALEWLFQALWFDVKIERNLGRQQMLKILDDISREDHSSYNCLVLFLMSYGRDGTLYGADGETVTISTVRDLFSNERCPTLKGKPRLIFIQSCRYSQIETPVEVGSTYNLDEPKAAIINDDAELTADEANSDKYWSFDSTSYKTIPDHADFLIANSTVSGHASYRNEHSGSRFVQCIVEVFLEFAGYEDVLSMLTMVNERISEMGLMNTKQVSEPTTTLRKKLYFWPGL